MVAGVAPAVRGRGIDDGVVERASFEFIDK